MVRVFTNGPKDQGSIPGRVIPKTQKMVLDAALLSTQHYLVQIKGKVEQSREWGSALPYASVKYCKGNLRVTLVYSRQIYLLIYKGNLKLNFLKVIFLMQVSLGKEKSFGKLAKGILVSYLVTFILCTKD